jgi:hypothetical protein
LSELETATRVCFQKGERVSMEKALPAKWDRMIVIEPRQSRERVESILGASWVDFYLSNSSSIDGAFLLVFADGKNVTMAVDMVDSTIDVRDLAPPGIFPRANANFRVLARPGGYYSLVQ